MSSLLRFAIIGFGNIGKRHAEHIINNAHAQLVAVVDSNQALQSVVPEGVCFYAQISDMLSKHQPDVLCVCTPNYLHEPHTIMGLEAGMHVVVEKPMAISVASCERMIQTAEKANKRIFAVKQNRYNPPVQLVKALMSQQKLGKIDMIQVNCFWNRGDAYYANNGWRGKKNQDGGCLFTQFSHFVDILYYLNGDIQQAQGLVRNFAHQHNTEIEDTGTFIMKAANGSLVTFSFTTCSYEKNMEGSITIFGELGTVKIGGQYLNTIEYQKLQGAVLPEVNITAKANDYGLYQGSMSNHDKMIQNVVEVLLEGKPIMTTAEEGRDVVRIIEKMYHGAIFSE